MAIDFVTNDVARSIYQYAGSEVDGLPAFDNLAPTIQISYIEEAEAAIKSICKHIRFLATQVEPQPLEPVIKSILVALADSLDVRH
jgi:hypothetical protein